MEKARTDLTFGKRAKIIKKEGTIGERVIKSLVMGLDDATSGLIEPLCNDGKLPSLKKLMSQGVRGTLENTFPSLTARTWT